MTGWFLHEPGESIRLADLDACCRFKTDSSISFDLGFRGEGLFDVIGWLDVHYPCQEDHCKVQIRMRLPDEEAVRFEDKQRIERLVQELFAAFAIPDDVGYEVRLTVGGSGFWFIHRDDVF